MSSIVLENASASYKITGYASAGMLFPRKVFKNIRALDGIFLELHTGDRVGLIGSNGSGKSTLLKVMGGLLPLRAGRMQVEGERMVLLDRRAGMIPQATLYQNAVIKAASLGLKGGQLDKYARDVLESAGLTDRINDPLTSLSSGMSAQFTISLNSRVAKPIMLLDEWIGTTNVDKSSEDGLLQRINEHTDIVVLASHNKQLIRQLCNKVIYLCKGRLVYFGSNKQRAYTLLADE